MIRSRIIPYLHLVLWCLVLLLCSLGCKDEEPGDIAEDEPVKVGQPDTQTTDSQNDVSRLDKIVDRINKASGGNHIVIFGVDDGTNGALTAIDYSLFERLGDDAVAVMIAEVILADKSEPAKSTAYGSRSQDSLQIGKVIATNERVGGCVAKAGFGSEGFSDWLKARSYSARIQDTNGVSDNMRTKAFMRGFDAQTNR